MLGGSAELLRRARRLGSAPFFALMATASGLSLLKGFILAAILQPLDFGIYATFFAIGSFSASLLSFGLIERSYKRFPRLLFDGQSQQALHEADEITGKLLLRTMAVGTIVVLCMTAMRLPHIVLPTILGLGVAGSAAILSNYISLQRAKSNLNQIGATAILRAALAVILATIGAMTGSAQAALSGEFAGAAITAAVIRWLVKRDRAGPRNHKQNQVVDPKEKELWLFFGFLIAAGPLYLDRAVVGLLLGEEVLGLYALLMLFVFSAYSVTAVASQKLGPELVRMQRGGEEFAAMLRKLLVWVGGIAALFLTGLTFVYLLFLAGPFDIYAEKYPVTIPLLLATAVLGAFQTTHLTEWFLIAFNEERSVFLSSAIYFVCLMIGIAIIALTNSGLLAFIAVMAVAKAIHFLTLLTGIGFLSRRQVCGSMSDSERHDGNTL